MSTTVADVNKAFQGKKMAIELPYPEDRLVKDLQKKLQNALLQVLEEHTVTIGPYDVDYAANFLMLAIVDEIARMDHFRVANKAKANRQRSANGKRNS